MAILLEERGPQGGLWLSYNLHLTGVAFYLRL